MEPETPQPGQPDQGQPAVDAPVDELVPLEAHIVALRAQLAHTDALLYLTTGTCIVLAAVILWRGLGVRGGT